LTATVAGPASDHRTLSGDNDPSIPPFLLLLVILILIVVVLALVIEEMKPRMRMRVQEQQGKESEEAPRLSQSTRRW
jgi:hypothetical protein